MGVNKVVCGGSTLIDISVDTAIASDVARGKTFHLADGTQAVGTMIVDRGLRLCGGRIFYIDNTSTGAEYTFYDINGNTLTDVRVGDSPYYYKITGVSNKDKYYIFNDNAVTNKTWTYKNSQGEWVAVLLGTEDGIGKGKTNTATVMSADSGAYANYSNTIWNSLKSLNNNADKDCTDWFIPSLAELLALRTATDREGKKLTNLFNNNIWSSSEYIRSQAWMWNSVAYWQDMKFKYSTCLLLAVRSF